MKNLKQSASLHGEAIAFLGNQNLPITKSKRGMKAGMLLNVVSTILLIATQLIAVAAVFVWAVSNLLGLPMTIEVIFGMIVAVPTLWAVLKVVKLAIDVEINFENEVASAQ